MFGRTKKDEPPVRVKPDTTTEQPCATTEHCAATTKRPGPTTEHPGGLTTEHVVWAYRLLLDREPESDAVIGPKLAGSRNTSELRHHLMTSAEFQQKNRDYAHTNDRTIVIKELDSVPGGVRLFVDLSDHVIGLNIVRDRYEQDEVRYVEAVLQGRRYGHRRRGPHWVLHNADGRDGRGGGPRVRLRAVRSERRAPRTIDCRKQIQRSRCLSASGRRFGVGHGDAHVPCRNPEFGRSVSSAGRDFAAPRQPEEECAARGPRRCRAAAAGPIDQDGRGRRGAPGDSRRSAPTERRSADYSLRAASDAA